MKLAVTLFDVDQVDRLLDLGADILIAGQENHANRLVASFSRDELATIKQRAHARDAEWFAVVNGIVHPDQVDDVAAHLDELAQLDVDGILFGDLAIYELAKERQLTSRLIYHPETLNTNVHDPVFWQRQGIRGIVLAKEITLDEIVAIGAERPIELTMIGHGHLNMFHSRRPLVSHYLEHASIDPAPHLESRRLRLVEEVRKESYPIVQDAHGTHIFRERPMASFDAFHALMPAIDVFVIDGILKTPAYVEEVLSDYHRLRQSDADDQSTSRLARYADHDTGFLYRPTELVKDKEDRS